MNANALLELDQQEPAKPQWLMKSLSEKHKLVAALLAQGIDNITVAKAADFTPEYITMLKNQPLFIAYVKEMTAAASTQLEALFCQSVDVIAGTMTNGNADERLKAAKLQMEATGRINRGGELPRQPAGDRLDILADRLVALLQTQRKRIINVDVSTVEVEVAHQAG